MENYILELIRVAKEIDSSIIHIFNIMDKDAKEYQVKLDYFNIADCFSLMQVGGEQLDAEKFKEIFKFLVDKTREINQIFASENSQIIKV